MPNARELRQVRYAPITRPFEPVARLSLEIAGRRGTLTSDSGDDTSGVLIDVAELWELFLLHCARRALGDGRVEHGAGPSSSAFLLTSSPDANARIGRLKPDLLIGDGQGREVAVIDAKYKRLRNSRERPNGVDRGDLYQLVAYLAGHDVSYGALAYPPGDDRPAPLISAPGKPHQVSGLSSCASRPRRCNVSRSFERSGPGSSLGMSTHPSGLRNRVSCFMAACRSI